jgi:hypothetical protein
MRTHRPTAADVGDLFGMTPVVVEGDGEARRVISGTRLNGKMLWFGDPANVRSCQGMSAKGH